MKPYFCDEHRWNVFLEEMESWYGTPYRHLQRAKGVGADCTMFFGQALINVGILSEISYDYYPRDWHCNTDDPIVENSILDNFNKHVTDPSLSFIKIFNTGGDWVRGDILLMWTIKKSLSNHLGILLPGGERMIHASTNRGVENGFYTKSWVKRTRYKIRLICEE